MEGRADQESRAGKTRGISGEDRLPGKVARLLDAYDQSRTVCIKRAALGDVRVEAAAEQDRQASGSHGIRNNNADGERLLQPEDERDCFPGRHFTAAILFRERG